MEKVDFILYQMKLVLGRRDFVRCQILSRKISKKHLNEKGLDLQKIQYYRFMVQYYVHEKQTLESAKAYQIIYDTYASKPDELDPTGNERAASFKNFVCYLLLTQYSNEKVDLLNIVNAKYARELDSQTNEILARYLRRFLTAELLPFNAAEIENSIKGYEPFIEGETENASTHLQEFLR